jgi:hypothetical protein
MKTAYLAGTTSLLILLLSWTALPAGEVGGIQMHVRGGVAWGGFDEINRSQALGASFGITKGQHLLLEGAYDYFKASNKTRFMSQSGEDLGIRDYPVYRVRNVLLSVSYLFHHRLGPVRLFGGPGIGYQWTRFVERGPTYGLPDNIDGWEHVYSGSAPVLSITGGTVLEISTRWAISVPLEYRHARVGDMKLVSSKGAEPEGNSLVDASGKKIPVDLSGFTIGVGLTIRLGGVTDGI